MKTFKNFIAEAKKCPKGQYYCFTDKKCKKIPTGYRIGYGGRLAPDNHQYTCFLTTLNTQSKSKILLM